MTGAASAPPEKLVGSYPGWSWDAAWGYEGVPTVWRMTSADGLVLFAKVRAAGAFPSIGGELARLRWLDGRVPVATVVDEGTDGERDWFVMRPVPGLDATVHPWRAEPARLVPAFAGALRAFHDALPVADCPFDARSHMSLERLNERAEAGAIDPARDFHSEFAALSVDDAIAELARLAPVDEDLVVGHVDYCLPNVMLDEHGAVTGYLDLGEVGLVDRRFDVVVGAWSSTWNLGPGWEQLFYDSYGIVMDDATIRHFRLLYDLVES